MRKRADAFELYGAAATLDQLVSVLPEVIRAASEPVGAIDKITVLSTDGASAMTKAVAGNVASGMEVASSLLGVDVGALVSGLARRSGDGGGGNGHDGGRGAEGRGAGGRPAPEGGDGDAGGTTGPVTS